MFQTGQRYFIDSNVFLYAAGEVSSLKMKALETLEKLSQGGAIAVTNTAVIEEIHFICYRQTKDVKFCLNFLNDVQKGLGGLLPMTEEVVRVAIQLFERSKQKVSIKDYYHVASMLVFDIETIVSFDSDFDRFREIIRIGKCVSDF